MPLDPKLIREAQAAYRQWNEAELRERLHAVTKPSAQEAWRRYVARVEFCWKLAPQQSEQERARKVADISQYYARVQNWKHGENGMERGLEALLPQAISVLAQHGYRYAIIGGVALSQWGVVRATYDVDIKILVPSCRSNTDRLLSKLKRFASKKRTKNNGLTGYGRLSYAHCY